MAGPPAPCDHTANRRPEQPARERRQDVCFDNSGRPPAVRGHRGPAHQRGLEPASQLPGRVQRWAGPCALSTIVHREMRNGHKASFFLS